MNDFNRCNKVSGIYWLKNDLENLILKVKLKPQNGIILLPKFEDYSQSSNTLNLENTTEEYDFRWQEKIFSRWEMHWYMDPHNCITETDLDYHDMIKNEQQTPCKIFTYVHKDNNITFPLGDNKISDISKLESCLGHLSINNSLEKIFGSDITTVSTTDLFKSQENVKIKQDEWMSMHVVFDNSDYNEDSQLVYKQEVALVSLYYNSAQNYLIITPDINNLELNPYKVETLSAVQWGYEYAVDLQFDAAGCSDELVMLLRKLYTTWEKKQKHLLNFQMPAHGRTQYHVTLEILTAAEFDKNNLYIKFDVQVPEELVCKDIVQGRTHTSESVSIEGADQWHFGHLIEFTLETDSKTDPVPVKLFLEAISSDWWGRHRTEGYTYLHIPLNPGCYTKNLRCKRPEESNTVEGNSRRFFLGGCHLIKDLNVLLDPQLDNANFAYTTTGTIAIRWNIISHCQIGAISSAIPDPKYGTSTASALLKGAEAALHKYRQARARLAAVTDQLSDGQSSSQPLTNRQ